MRLRAFPVSALSVSGTMGLISACLSIHFREKGTPIGSRKGILFLQLKKWFLNFVVIYLSVSTNIL